MKPAKFALFVFFMLCGTVVSVPAQDFRESFISSTETYRASLERLLITYQDDAAKLDQDSAKFKNLYDQGLISRVEYESRIAKKTEADTKLSNLRRQIALTDVALAEARRVPATDEAVNQPATFSQVAWSTGNAGIDALIRANGTRYGVDPYLIYCVIRHESSFVTTAVSVKGAQGLMQLMPGTAARYGVTNPNDPAQNIRGGTRYLKDLLKLFNGRIDLVLAGYNAGEGAVIQYGQTVPPYKETRNYVRLISQRYFRATDKTDKNR